MGPLSPREPLTADLSRAAAIKVIGLGGVGGIVTRYLAVYLGAAASPVRVVCIDGDEFEPGNASRMFFSRCGNKAEVTVDDLAERVEGTGVTLVPIEEFVTTENLPRLVREGDIVFLAVDNHATRKLVSEHCARLDDVCLISGGNDGVGEDSTGAASRGTFGNVQIQWRAGGEERSPDLARFHPEIAEPADKLPTDVSCTDALASVPQLLFTNLATASAMLNAFQLFVSDALEYAELCFDVRDGLMRPVIPISAPQTATR